MDNNNEIQVIVASDDSQGFTVGDGVDGVVSHDEVNLPEDSAPAAPESRHKKRSLRSEQIQRENAVLRRQNEEMQEALRERDEYLRRQHDEIEQRKQAASEAEVAAAESTLSEREQNILGQIKYAKTEGLVDDEILLTNELSKLQADRSALNLLSDMRETEDSEATYFEPAPVRRAVPAQPQYPEAFYSFLDRHPELNPESGVFDPRLFAAANSKAEALTSLMRNEGKPSNIGTDFFYDLIESSMFSKTQPTDNMLGVSRDDQLYDVRDTGVRNISKEELSFIRNLPVYLDDGTEASETQKIERYLKAGKNIQKRQSGSTIVL